MTKRLRTALVVFVVVLAAAQFVRPSRMNPPTNPARTMHASVSTPSAVVAVVNRSCRDCHSNQTVWPWYTQVAPLSWVMSRAVKEGREAVNFSEWAGYRPEQQQALLDASCDAAAGGTMPGVYARLRPETRLSPEDIDTICAAARNTASQAAGISP